MTQYLNLLAELIGEHTWLAPMLALAAGVLTSLTPCSLSSVPLVIAYVGGSAGRDSRRAFRLSLTMAAGLTVTFLVFGSLASVIGHYLHDVGAWWYGILAVVMVVMALQVWGVIHLIPEHKHDAASCGHEQEEACCHNSLKVRKKGYPGALLAGMISGTAASHCSTPVMIALLALAAQSDSALWGIFLLALFAVGHSILLILAGTGYSVVERWMYHPGYKKISRILRGAMGSLILLMGIAMFYMALFYHD